MWGVLYHHLSVVSPTNLQLSFYCLQGEVEYQLTNFMLSYILLPQRYASDNTQDDWDNNDAGNMERHYGTNRYNSS